MVDPTEPSHRAVSRESVELVEAMMAPDAANRVPTYEDLIDRRIDALPAMSETGYGMRGGHAISVTYPRTYRLRRWRRCAIAVSGSLALAAFGIHFGLPSAPVRAVNRPIPKYVSAGPISLLNPNRLADWMPPAAGGSWVFAQDGDLCHGADRNGLHPPFVQRPGGLPDHVGSGPAHGGRRGDSFCIAEGHCKRPALCPADNEKRHLFGAKDSDKAAFQPLGGSRIIRQRAGSTAALLIRKCRWKRLAAGGRPDTTAPKPAASPTTAARKPAKCDLTPRAGSPARFS